MTYIIHRYLPESENFNPEFSILRNAYWDSPGADCTLGNWLRERGAEKVITSISEEDALHYDTDDDYMVMEVHFKSEGAYLAFKLKHLT